MKIAALFLGGWAAVVLATSSFADLPTAELRPLSREDVVALRQAAEHARLAAFRAKERPAHMIRYPVVQSTDEPAIRPRARSAFLPNTRWSFQDGSDVWTRAAMSAVGAHGGGLDSLVPRDIAAWCPAYEDNPRQMRRAFWVGMMSALSKHESTYNPGAVGGGGQWYGLLQIYPQTARHYGCRAQTGEALKDAADNLSCAARIMAVTVARDNAVAVHNGRWRGVAADWGPMTKRSKIAEMSAWTRRQDYCQPVVNMRPRERPDGLDVTISTMGASSSSG